MSADDQKQTGFKEQVFACLPGMRIVKTALAVYLGFMIDTWRGNTDLSTAAIAAVVCLQIDIRSTFEAAVNRSIGTALAGVYSYLFLVFASLASLHAPSMILYYSLVALAAIPLMQLFVLMDKKKAMGIGIIVYLLITITTEPIDPLAYTFTRVLNTFVGIFSALFVNWLPPVNAFGRWYMKHKGLPPCSTDPQSFGDTVEQSSLPFVPLAPSPSTLATGEGPQRSEERE